MENAQRSAQMLRHLKELNITVCVDDFGTGYSSLSYLHTFPIDTLTIDKSFVQDMGRNRHNLEIVRTEEQPTELQSLMRRSHAVVCLTNTTKHTQIPQSAT